MPPSQPSYLSKSSSRWESNELLQNAHDVLEHPEFGRGGLASMDELSVRLGGAHHRLLQLDDDVVVELVQVLFKVAR